MEGEIITKGPIGVDMWWQMGREGIRREEEAAFRRTRALWVLRPLGRGPSRLETSKALPASYRQL